MVKTRYQYPAEQPTCFSISAAAPESSLLNKNLKAAGVFSIARMFSDFFAGFSFYQLVRKPYAGHPLMLAIESSYQ